MKLPALRRPMLVAVAVVAAGTSLIAIDRLGAEEPAVDAATPTAAAPPAAVPGPTPTPRDAAATTAGADSFEGDTLPTDSQFDLPPMLLIQAPSGGSGDPKVLGRSVLRSRSLALSPAARRDIRSGRVSVEGLKLLVELGPIEAPLLVHRARGSKLRVQATTLDGTRKLVRSIADAGTATVSLRPVRRDFADLEQSKAEARASEIGSKVTAIALAQVGIPYSWGGGNARGASTGTCNGYRGSIRPCPATRTVGFDCSGLTLYAYAQVGITLDHYAAFQWLEGRRIPATDLMPGDLVFFHPKRDGPGHMGMYVGTGRFVHAPRTGDWVKVSSLSDYAGSYMGAVRPF